MISLGGDENYGYPPLQYDTNAVALDYFFKPGTPFDSAFVVASTPFNVYSIVETRDASNDITGIKTEEIVTGTFKCNVASIRYPAIDESIVISKKGIVKAGFGADWALTGLAPSSDGSDLTYVDIATNFDGLGAEYAYISSMNSTGGGVLRSVDGGTNWTPLTLPTSSGIIALDCARGEGTYVYAADEHYLYVSPDYGDSWSQSSQYLNSSFKDITATDTPGIVEAFACGSGEYKVLTYDGNMWIPLQDGLGSVNEVRSILHNRACVTSNNCTPILYVTTDQGIYKSIDYGTWTLKDYDMGPESMGAIVMDNQDYREFDTGYLGLLATSCLTSDKSGHMEVLS